MRRHVEIWIKGSEVDYRLAVLIIARQLVRGQVRGEGDAGTGSYRYEVITDHTAPEEPTRDDR
jgi:hypothetical protein